MEFRKPSKELTEEEQMDILGDSSEEPSVIEHQESRDTCDGPDPAVRLRFHHLDPDKTISD